MQMELDDEKRLLKEGISPVLEKARLAASGLSRIIP